MDRDGTYIDTSAQSLLRAGIALLLVFLLQLGLAAHNFAHAEVPESCDICVQFDASAPALDSSTPAIPALDVSPRHIAAPAAATIEPLELAHPPRAPPAI